MSIPNILTVIRIILVPVVAYLFYIDQTFAAGICFLAACLTDVLDGFIARRFNMVTKLGKVLDPLADKLMTVTVLVCMALKHFLSWWLIAIFAVKDLVMVAFGIVLYKRDIVIASHWFGKLASFIIWAVAAVILFFHGQLSGDAKLYMQIVAAAAAVLAFFGYAKTLIGTLSGQNGAAGAK